MIASLLPLNTFSLNNEIYKAQSNRHAAICHVSLNARSKLQQGLVQHLYQAFPKTPAFQWLSCCMVLTQALLAEEAWICIMELLEEEMRELRKKQPAGGLHQLAHDGELSGSTNLNSRQDE